MEKQSDGAAAEARRWRRKCRNWLQGTAVRAIIFLMSDYRDCIEGHTVHATATSALSNILVGLRDLTRAGNKLRFFY